MSLTQLIKNKPTFEGKTLDEWFLKTLPSKLLGFETLLQENNYDTTSKINLADISIYSFLCEYFDNKTDTKNAYKDCEILKVNLLDQAKLAQLLKGRSFDGVIHFAAKSLVGESVQKPDLYYRNNVVGTLNLINEMINNVLNLSIRVKNNVNISRVLCLRLMV